MDPGQKPTNEELEARIEIVKGLVIDGWSNRQIFEKYGAEWDVSSRTIYNYTNRANEEISKEAAPYKMSEFQKALKRLTQQYHKADKIGDRKNAIAAQKAINDLLSLDEVGRQVATETEPLLIKRQVVKPIQRSLGDGKSVEDFN